MEIPEGYAQANFFYTGPAVPTGAQMTLGLEVVTFAGTAADMAQALVDAYLAAVMGGTSANGCVNVGIGVKLGPTLTGPSGFAPNNSPGGATAAGSQPQVSVLIHKQTSAGGRAGRGRCYEPGAVEGFTNESGILNPETVTAIQAQWDAFQAELLSAELNPVVLHTAGSPITTPTEIDSFVVDPKVATQRRRNRR